MDRVETERSSSSSRMMGAAEFDVCSTKTGRSYRIYTYAPVDQTVQGRLPVVYITDGNMLFHAAMMQAVYMTEIGEIEPALIVGIGYSVTNLGETVARRRFDLTPCAPEVEQRQGEIRGGEGAQYGGAEAFLTFITDELEPMLDALYKIDARNRTIFGHSLGGLFALYSLLRHPAEFRTFVAASPSIWWNGKSILQHLPRFRHAVEIEQSAPRVLITVGALEESTERARVIPADMTPELFQVRIQRRRAVENARELSVELRGIQGTAGYHVQFTEFEAETHASVVGAALSRGLVFALTPKSS